MAALARKIGDVILVVDSASTSRGRHGWMRHVRFGPATFDVGDETPFLRMLVVVDDEPQSFEEAPPSRQPRAHHVPVAVIGAGKSTLSRAEQLTREGFNVRTYHAQDVLQGLIWLAIDGTRSRKILRHIVRMAEELGSVRALPSVVDALKVRAATPGTVAIIEERDRIARDLHDGLCSSLAGLRMRVGVLAATHDDDGMRGELELLGSKLEGVLDDLRSFVWLMRIDNPTAEQLLSHIGMRVTQSTGARVVTEPEQQRPLVTLSSTQASRIVREAHAAACDWIANRGVTSLTLRMVVATQQVRVEIRPRDEPLSTSPRTIQWSLDAD